MLLTLAFTMQGLWQVSMDDLRFDGDKILFNIPVVLDTGANLIYGDWDVVKDLYEPLGGISKEIGGFDYYYRESLLRSVPCSY
jgi:hypothetical protein